MKTLHFWLLAIAVGILGWWMLERARFPSSSRARPPETLNLVAEPGVSESPTPRPATALWAKRAQANGPTHEAHLPSAIEEVLRAPWQPISFKQLAGLPGLSQEEERLLGMRCLAETSLTNCLRYFQVLAYHGDEIATSVLTSALTNQFAGQRLSPPEEVILVGLPLTIGPLARHNDEAFGFLERSLAADFWHEHRGWEFSNRGECVKALTAMTLRGLATSGRQGVIALFRAQREPGSVGVRLGLQGTLVDAAFYLRLALDEGERFHRGESFETGEQMMRRFSAWRAQTAEGQEWFRWASASRTRTQPSKGPSH